MNGAAVERDTAPAATLAAMSATSIAAAVQENATFSTAVQRGPFPHAAYDTALRGPCPEIPVLVDGVGDAVARAYGGRGPRYAGPRAGRGARPVTLAPSVVWRL